MTTKVLEVEAKKYKDKDFYEVAFDVDGERKLASIWWDGAYGTVAAWKPGDEVEVELYEKDGKPRFKLPKQGGGGNKGGGYNSFTFEQKLHLANLDELSTNARTAVMQAIQLVGYGAVPGGDWIIEAARIYEWLQSKSSESVSRIPPSTDSGQAGAEVAPSPPASAPTSEAGGDDGEGVPPASANHTHDWKPVLRQDMAKKGWVACAVEGCTKTEKHAA